MLFERHGPAILAFCRQILGSHEEAEDAVQQTFASAHRALFDDDRPIDVKPWLYTIARNRCLSMVRARKPASLPLEEDLAPGAGMVDEVEQRIELRELVHDLADLPEQQRSALVLFELGDLSHEQIAGVLGLRGPAGEGNRLQGAQRAGRAPRRQVGLLRGDPRGALDPARRRASPQLACAITCARAHRAQPSATTSAASAPRWPSCCPPSPRPL